MVSFVIGILVTFVTLYIALIYASTAIGLLAFAQALLVALAFVYLSFLRTQIRAGIQIPVAVAERGQTVSVQIITTNKSRIPCMRIRYRLRLVCPILQKKRSFWKQGAAVFAGENRYQAPVGLQYAGSYRFELTKLRIYDLTGLFHMNKSVGKSACVQLLPETECAVVQISERTRNAPGDSDVYDELCPGDDRSELFGVREFRDGDKIQSIHWKLSAKSDTLIVREDSLPLACPVVLILENSRKKDMREAEACLSAAASLVFSLIDAHCRHYVSWFSGESKDMVRVRVDSDESYYIFLSRYLADTPASPNTSPQELYREKYRYDRPLYTLVLKPDLTLWQNEKRAGKIDGKDWKNSVRRLLLVL